MTRRPSRPRATAGRVNPKNVPSCSRLCLAPTRTVEPDETLAALLGRLAVDHRDGGLLATECLDLEGGKGVRGGASRSVGSSMGDACAASRMPRFPSRVCDVLTYLRRVYEENATAHDVLFVSRQHRVCTHRVSGHLVWRATCKRALARRLRGMVG